MQSAKFEVNIRINMMGSVPKELKQLLIMTFEEQMLKQERKKAVARYTLQRNIINVIKYNKLYDAFHSDATTSFRKDYRLKRIKLAQCLL